MYPDDEQPVDLGLTPFQWPDEVPAPPPPPIGISRAEAEYELSQPDDVREMLMQPGAPGRMYTDAVEGLGSRLGAFDPTQGWHLPNPLDVLGGAVEGFSDALNWENRNTAQKMLGNMADPAGPSWTLNPIEWPIRGRLNDPEVQDAFRQGGSNAAWDKAKETLPTGVAGAYETMYDPISLLGSWGKIARELPGVGRVAGPVVSAIEAPIRAGVEAPINAALGAFRGGLGAANKAIDVVDNLLPGGGAGARRVADEANVLTQEALREVRDRGLTWDQIKQAPNSVQGVVSDKAADLINKDWVRIENAARSARGDQAMLENLERVVAGVDRNAADAMSLAADRDQYLNAAKAFLHPDDYARAERAFDRWGDDLRNQDPLNLVLPHLQRANAKDAGYLGPMGGLQGIPVLRDAAKGIANGLTLWKDAVLTTPRYLMQNAVGAGVMNSLAGVSTKNLADNLTDQTVGNLMKSVGAAGKNPLTWAQNFTAEAKRLHTDVNAWHTPSRVRESAAQWGVSVPMGVGGEGIMADEMGRNVWGEVPKLVRAGLGAIVGLPLGPAGSAAGAAYGLSLPKQVEVVRFLSSIIEGTARKTAWEQGMDTFVKSKLPEFAAAAAQRIAMTTGDQVGADRVRQALEASGGRFDVNRLVQIANYAGLDRPTTQSLVKGWSNILRDGSDAGVALANKANFNYQQPDNVESALRYISPFVLWAKRAMPFYGEALRDNPVLLVALNNLAIASDNETQNLGSRYAGTLSAGAAGAAISQLIYGREGDARINPLSGATPFANFAGGVDQSRSPSDAVVQTLSNFGLGTSPPVQEAMFQGGIIDRPPTWTRPAAPAKAITGTNFEDVLRGGIHQITGLGRLPERSDYPVVRRIHEMALEATGHTLNGPAWNNPTLAPFQAAKDDPNHPIYQAALKDVQRELQGRTAMTWLNPVEMDFINATERRVLPEQALLPEMHRPSALEWLQSLRQRPQVRRDPATGDLIPETARADFQRIAAEHPLSLTYVSGQAPIGASDLAQAAAGYDSPRTRDAAFELGAGWLPKYRAWAKERGVNPADQRVAAVYLKEQDRKRGIE